MFLLTLKIARIARRKAHQQRYFAVLSNDHEHAKVAVDEDAH